MKRSTNLSRLITLAKFARKRIETLSKVEKGPPHLQGYCGIASRYLELLGKRENIFPDFIVGHFRSFNRILDEYSWRAGHCWIEYDGYIIDLTATQFRNVITKVERDFSKKVYISRNTNPHYYKEASGEDAVNKVRAWHCESLEEICAKVDEIA